MLGWKGLASLETPALSVSRILMKVVSPFVHLAIIALGISLSGCSKKEDPATPGGASNSSKSAGDTAVDKPAVAALSYKESVRAGFENLALKMSFVNEKGEPQTWNGTLTIFKDRFATVEHPSRLQKVTHLRRWAEVHYADIPDSGQPPAPRDENSPLANRRLIADLLDNGGWKHHLEGVPREQKLSADVVKMIDELDRLETAAASFYANRDLKVGESWQVPAAGATRWFGDMIEDLSGDINVKVDREGKVQDQACLVLAVDLKLAGKISDPDGQALDVKLNGSGEIWRATDLDLDLKTEINGQAQLGVAVEANQISMDVQGPLKISEERTLVQ